MTKKYVVKNCPANYYYAGVHYCEDNHDEKCRNTYCQNINDCVIKQVVEKCKNIECPCEYKGTDCLMCGLDNSKLFAEKLLQLFAIEEVE